jgi:hypothetical protein
VQAKQGLNQAVSLGAAAAGGDTTECHPGVQVMCAVGGTATTVTITPVGPFIGLAAPKVYAGLQNQAIPLPTWDQKNQRGSFRFARVDITYSQVTGVTVGAFTNLGG